MVATEASMRCWSGCIAISTTNGSLLPAAAIHCGARLVGTNSDSTYPSPRGLEPGGGSILAAVATAGNAVPTIAGKPHAPMAHAIARHLSTG